VRLAQVRTDQKDFSEAARLLDEAQERAGEDRHALALVRMGQVYLAMQSRDTDRALEVIAENEDLWADHPYAAATVHSNEAVIYARRRDYDRARDLLVDVLDLDPYFYTARALFGQIAAMQRDHELAVDQLLQVVENRDDVGAQVYYSLAMSLVALGRQEEANEHLRRALEKGLPGLPALTARLNLMFPNKTVRIIAGVLFLATVAAVAFRLLSPVAALILVAVLGLTVRQILRGGM